MIKEYRQSQMDGKDILSIFLHEARETAQLIFPNFCHFRDYFQINDAAYLVIDNVEGNTMSREIENCGGKISWQRVLALMKPLILMIEEFHQKQILHLGIKPNNMKIRRNVQTNEEKLILLYPNATDIYRKRNWQGTSSLFDNYDSFETYKSESKLGPFSDEYSLCVTMYKAISGISLPWALDRAIYSPIVPSFKSIGLDVPSYIERAIFHGMAVMSEERTQSMYELYDELTYKSAFNTCTSAQKE